MQVLSPPRAGVLWGPAWWRALVDRVEAGHPGLDWQPVLDCGESAGTVLAALRLGLRHLRFTGDPALAAVLAGAARSVGATLYR